MSAFLNWLKSLFVRPTVKVEPLPKVNVPEPKPVETIESSELQSLLRLGGLKVLQKKRLRLLNILILIGFFSVLVGLRIILSMILSCLKDGVLQNTVNQKRQPREKRTHGAG